MECTVSLRLVVYLLPKAMLLSLGPSTFCSVFCSFSAAGAASSLGVSAGAAGFKATENSRTLSPARTDKEVISSVIGEELVMINTGCSWLPETRTLSGTLPVAENAPFKTAASASSPDSVTVADNGSPCPDCTRMLPMPAVATNGAANKAAVDNALDTAFKRNIVFKIVPHSTLLKEVVINRGTEILSNGVRD